MSDLINGPKGLVLLLLFGAIMFLPGIASMPALDRDESRYMQASRQMMETGDYVQIRYQDTARNKKPVGIYWLQVASVQTLSEPATTERWPYRVPSVLGALLVVLLTFFAGKTLFDRKTGYLAGAMMAACLGLVFDQQFAKTDAVLLATVIAAQLALARGYMAKKRGEETGWWNAVLLWGALGIGILIKGPIAPLVAALTWLCLRVFDKETRFLGTLKPLPGILLMLLIAAPWFVAIITLTDGAFLEESAGRDFFGKLIEGQESHGAPPGYYLVLMTATFAPASLFVWTALRWGWSRRKIEPALLFCFVWIIPYWIIVELVPTKLPHYILPVYPALAILTARAVFAAEEGGVPRAAHWSARIAYVAWALLVVGFAAAAIALPLILGEPFNWVSLIPAVTAAVALVYVMPRIWAGRPLRPMIAALLAAPLFYAPIFLSVLPDADAIWPSREVAQAVREQAGDPPAISSSGYTEPSLVFYLGTETRLIEPEPAVDMLRTVPGSLAIVEGRKQDAFDAAVQAAGIEVEALETVEGFNYSQGRWVRLTLYRARSADE